MTITCIVCGRTVEGSPEELRFRPFCSKRCKLIDLGRWLNGDYRVVESVQEAELDEGAGRQSGSDSKN